MNAWTDNERNKLFNYMSKTYDISFNNAKYITDECHQYMLALTNLSLDFEKVLKLTEEYQIFLIKRCKKP